MPAGNRCDDAGAAVYASDSVVFGIDYYDVILLVASNRFRRAPSGQESRSAISGVASFSGAGQGRHDSPAVHFSYPVALPLGDVSIPNSVLADSPGTQDTGL